MRSLHRCFLLSCLVVGTVTVLGQTLRFTKTDRCMAESKARRITAGLPYFEIQIGIHTGPVVAGIVGVKKFQYDIWGDTVNTASRMESSGEVGQVNISESTYALVKDAIIAEDGVESTHRVDRDNDEVNDERIRPIFTFTPRGKVQAKGKGELEMFFVHHSSERA